MSTYYIATSLKRNPAHNMVRDVLQKDSHTLTYDWTVHGSVKEESYELLREVGQKELMSVAEADIVVVLLPGGFGTHTELGAALALKKDVIIHSEDPSVFTLGEKTCAFYHHEMVTQIVCPLEEAGMRIMSYFSGQYQITH